MILFTNGCSWTWGGGLGLLFKKNDGTLDHKKRLDAVWPAHLGKLLSVEKTINLAEGCGSNQRVVRTTYDWLRTQPEEVLKETIAIIQFTELSRFEFYEPLEQEKYENLPGQWVKCKWDLVNTDSIHKSKWDPELMLQKAKKRVAETHEIEDLYRTIGYIYALEGMFKLFGVKQWYLWHINNGNGWARDFNVFDTNKILNEHLNILDSDQLWEYEKISKDDPHPNLSGHKQIANIIYEKISVKN